MASKDGKIFQEAIEASCVKEKIFCDRIKDQFIPHDIPEDIRRRIPVSKNKYDFYIFNKYLFPVELKSTKSKSWSFDESKTKQHQLEALVWASKFEGTIPGLIINFREPENKCYFIHINDLMEYKHISENEIKDHMYKNKINKSSIPISICEEIGIEITNHKKISKYHYHIEEFIGEAIRKYGKK